VQAEGKHGPRLHDKLTTALSQNGPAMKQEPINGPLILRYASNRSSRTWGPDDYDVIHDGRDIGRIFKPAGGIPPDRPWKWTITGAIGWVEALRGASTCARVFT